MTPDERRSPTAERTDPGGGRGGRGPRATSSTRSSCPRSSTGSSRWAGRSRSASARSAPGGSIPSYARIAIRAATAAELDEILGDLVEHGASPVDPEDARVVPADIAGAFPEDFYSTTNQRTQVRLGGRWIDVADQEMDCGIAVDPAGRVGAVRADDRRRRSACRSSSATRACGSSRSSGPARRRLFGFMGSNVSSEKPKAVSLQGVADSIRATRAEGKKVLLVGGPAIVHTGSAGARRRS